MTLSVVRPHFTTAAAATLFLALAVFNQARGGAFVLDLATYPDEPAHYVTGLMVRDYLIAFPWPAPMPFAERFYAHYPMVSIGHWPPFFYLVQGLWTLMVGPSKGAVLFLIALLAAATATVLFRFWQRRFGSVAAAFLALAFLATPVVQEFSRMVMAEALVTLLVVLAVLAYARYLEEPRRSRAVWFALLASAAIMTKSNGLALGLAPVFAVLVTRRFELVTRASFWIPAVIVLALCAPWYVLTADLAREGWSASYSPSWLIAQPARYNAIALMNLAGIPVFILSAAGVAYMLWLRRQGSLPVDWAHWAMMLVLLLIVWVFHSFVAPVREPRHLMPAVVPLLGFSALAVSRAGVRFFGDTAERPLTIAYAAVLFAALWFAGSALPRQPGTGIDLIVTRILSEADPASPLLVSSANMGEGVLIAELAGREERPGHRVIRASKLLAQSDWNASEYRLLGNSPQDLERRVLAAGVRRVVFDTAPPMEGPVPHHDLLGRVLADQTRWRNVHASPPGARFQVFTPVTAR